MHTTRHAAIESILGGTHASMVIEDGMSLLETPERLAKLREMFKVGAPVKYVRGEDGILRPDRKVPADGVPLEVFDAIVKRDPTAKVSASGEVEKCGIYTQWLLGQYVKSSTGARSRFIEDLYKATDALAIYDRRKGRLPVELRNIAAIKTIIDLERVVATLADQRTRGEKREEVEAGAAEVDVLMDTEQWRVVVPRTVAASRFYGKGTRWCTASSGDDAPGHFNAYSRKGPLIIAINHGDQRRWQFHFESGQYMDEQDEPIDAAVFFRNAPEVGAAILRYLRGRGTVLAAILDLISPEEALSEYTKLAAESEKAAAEYLHKLSMPTILKGFESGIIGERMLNRQFGDYMVFDKEEGRIAYRVDDLLDLSRFFSLSHGWDLHKRRFGTVIVYGSYESDSDVFRKIVTGELFDGATYGVTPAEVEDSVSKENYDRMKRMVEQHGRLDFDKLPPRLDAAVRGAANTAIATAQAAAKQAECVRALELVLGGMETNDSGVLFWNSIEEFTKDMHLALRALPQITVRYGAAVIDDTLNPTNFLDALAHALPAAGGGRVRMRDIDAGFRMDSDEFNRQLKVELDASGLDAVVETVESKNERIVSAAVRLPDGTVRTGPFHNAIYDDIADEAGGYEGLMGRIYDPTKPQDLQRAKDGFMTNTGRFVTRQEAHSIAKAANQVAAHARDEVELSSEDAMRSDAEWDRSFSAWLRA